MKKSLTSTMQTRRPPTDSDAEALVAFLSTLDHPMNPHRAADDSLSKIARKGKSLFEGKAGCATCHRGQHFTFQGTFDVGLGSPQDAYPEYNPPVLRGLYA